VLYEAMADKQTRKSRAQALQVLGRLFQQAALAATAGTSQVRGNYLICPWNLLLELQIWQ